MKEHTLERSGCPVHYWVTEGDETMPVMVFMHGATMDHRMFAPQVEAFKEDYRVLTWDARGHGQSQPIGEGGLFVETMAADMLAVLDDIGVQQAIIGGQSLGGYIAQYLYKQAPERVQAMIVIGSTPISKGYSPFEVWALKATMPLFDLWPYGHFTKMVARTTARRPEVQAYALDAIRQIEREDFLTVWKSVTLAVDRSGHPDLRIEVPLLLMHGEYDRAGTIKRDMPRWAEAEPEATFHIIPDASHNANQDNPDVTNRVIRAFLDDAL